MEYYFPDRIQTRNNFIDEKLKSLAEILSISYDNFKQLALKATVRKPQLIIHNLASQTHACYIELVAQIQQIENKILPFYKKSEYSGEWRVIPFSRVKSFDNTDEIFSQCKALKRQIQNAYNELLENDSLSREQKDMLKYQLNGLNRYFLKLAE